jgi:hypothetical protein
VKEECVEHVTTGQWFVTMLITAIPLIGLIMIFVWAHGDRVSISKSNWAKAILIWSIVYIVILVFIITVFGTTLLSYVKIG